MPQPTKKREGLDWSLLGPTEKPTASAPRAADGALNWSLLGRPVSAPANTAEGLIGRVLQPLPEPVEMTGPDLAELSLGTDFATAPDDEGRALVLSKRLPLANMTPEQVRDTATEAGLPPILLQERAAEARVNETLDLLRRYAPNVADRLEGTGRTWQDWAALLSQEEFVSRMERENPELAKRLKGLTVPRTARAATDPIRGDIGTTPAQRTFVEGTARTADVLATPLYVGEAIVGKGYRPRGAEALEVLEPPTSTAEAVGRGVAGLADTAVSMLAPSAPSAAAHALGGVARVLAPQRLKKAAQIAGGFGGFTAATAMPGVIAGEQSAGQAGVSALTALPHAVTEALRGAGMSGAVIMRAIDRGEISPDEVREAFRGLEPAVAIPALLKQLKTGKSRDEKRLDRRLAESRIDEPAGFPPQSEPRLQITPEKRAAYEKAVAEEKAGEPGEPETQRATVVESLVEPVSKSLREQGYTVTVEPRGDRFEVIGTKAQPPKPPPSALTGAAAALKPQKGASREAQEQEGNVDARRDTAGGGGVGRDVQRLPDAAQGQGQAEGQGPQGPPAEVLITAAQRKMIFALGRERGIDKAALSGMAPGGSIAKLTKPQAGELINRLQAMPKKAPPQRPPPLQTKETPHAEPVGQAVGVHADVQQQPRAKAGAKEVPAEGRGAGVRPGGQAVAPEAPKVGAPPAESRQPFVKPKEAKTGEFQFLPDDVSLELATRAYAGISHTPERRAEQERFSYVEQMKAVHDELMPLARTDAQRAQLVDELNRYKSGFIQRLNAALQARSRTYSSMISGPSNFPARRMKKLNATADRRINELTEWSQRTVAAIRRNVFPESSRTISSDDPSAPELLGKRIEEMERVHRAMVEGNRIIRDSKLTDEQKAEKLKAVGLKQALIESAMKPVDGDRAGFPDFVLKNSSAEIRRLKARAAGLQKARSEETTERAFEGGRIVDSVEDNRLRVFFDHKPDDALRARLKSAGFRFAHSVSAWQRQRGPGANAAVERLLGDRMKSLTVEPRQPPAGETQAGLPRTGRTEDLNAAAQEAATSPTNARPEPTPAQQQAGNYKKGHVRFGGLDISIENPIGSTRSGADKGGKPWSVTMSAHYGYVKGTRAKDGDHVDVYLSGKPSKRAPAYIIDQYNPETGKFDEHKIVLGVAEQWNALRVYDAHFSDGSGPSRRRAVTQVPMEMFREWIEGGDTKRPAAETFSKNASTEVTRLKAPTRQQITRETERQPPALPTKALLEERQKVLDEAWEHVQSTGFDDFATRPERREYERRLASLDHDLLGRGAPRGDLTPLDRFIEARIMRRDSRTLAEQRRGTVVNLRPKEAPEPAPPGTRPAALEGVAFSKPTTYSGTKRIEVSHPDGKAGAWIERRKGESGWSVRLVDTVPQTGKAWPLNISQQIETNAPLNSAKAAAVRAIKEGFDRKKPIFNTYTYGPVSWSQVRPRSFPGASMPGGTAFMGGRRRGGRPIRFYKVRSVGAAISDYFGWGGTAGRQLVELTKRVYSKAAEFKGPAVEEFNEIMRGENAAAQNRVVEIAGGHAKPANPGEAAKAQAIKDLMQRQGALMEALDVRTAEGGRFRSLRDFVPGDLNPDYKRALLEGEKSGNPKFEEMVTRVVDALDRKDVEYVGGKIRKRESGKPRTPEQLRREALLWLRDWRSATLGEARKPRDDPSPLERFRRPIGEAGVEKSVQLHRLVDWPRHMLAENLADSVRRHLDRSARAIARRLVLGPRMEVPEKLIRQFYHDAITKAARRLNADPERFVRDAEVYLRQLLADPLGRPDIAGGHTTSFWRKTGRVLKGFANVGGVGLGTRMSLGVNQIWGLATTGLRFGYFRAMKHFLKNEKNFLLDVPVIGHRIKPTKAYQQALRRGALEGDTATMQLVNESALPESAKNVMMGFFAGHEAVIRSASAAAAVTWANARLPKIARVLEGAADDAHAKRLLRERADGRQLLELGLNVAGIRAAVQRGSFSESQMGQLMRGGVELTQPVFRSYSLPRFLQTESGKFWLQFKAAAYRQTDATLGHVLREAGHRNYWPAMRFLVAAPILGISAQGIGRFLAGKKLLPDDEERWSYGVRLIGDTLGIVDMPIDLAEDVTRSKSGAELVGRSAPPSVGMAAEMLSAAYRSVAAMYRGDDAGAKRAMRRSARSVGIGRLADRLIQAAGAPPISWTHELPYTESTADWDRAKRRFDAAYEPIRAAERLRSESRGVPDDPEVFDQAKREKATAAITEAIGSPGRWAQLKTELAGHRRIIAAAEKFMREKSREAEAAKSPETAAALRKRIDNAAVDAAKHYTEAEKLVRGARGQGNSRGFMRRVLEGSGAER